MGQGYRTAAKRRQLIEQARRIPKRPGRLAGYRFERRRFDFHALLSGNGLQALDQFLLCGPAEIKALAS